MIQVAERKFYDLSKLLNQQGIRCPKCHCRNFAEVRQTYPKGNAIKRTRNCRNCGQQIITWERPEPQ